MSPRDSSGACTVHTHSILISRAFWTLFALESVAIPAWHGLGHLRYQGSGPEGPVGAWLIYLVPPLFLGIPLAIVLIGRSSQATLAGLIFMAWPVIPLTIGPLYSALDSAASDHRRAGDFNFLWPSQRKLAHALQAHDAALVRGVPSRGRRSQRGALGRIVIRIRPEEPRFVSGVDRNRQGPARSRRGSRPSSFPPITGR